jgi:hypothetical protein
MYTCNVIKEEFYMNRKPLVEDRDFLFNNHPLMAGAVTPGGLLEGDKCIRGLLIWRAVWVTLTVV